MASLSADYWKDLAEGDRPLDRAKTMRSACSASSNDRLYMDNCL
jgi:hypothetical protein